jgi:hypothetical protein
MKISKATLLCLPSEGRPTLQVPQCVINIGDGECETEEVIEIPDDWVQTLKHVGNSDLMRPALSYEGGFTFMTRDCYEHFKLEIRDRIVSEIQRRIRFYGDDARQYLDCDFMLTDDKKSYITDEELFSMSGDDIWNRCERIIEGRFDDFKKGTAKFVRKLKKKIKKAEGELSEMKDLLKEIESA